MAEADVSRSKNLLPLSINKLLLTLGILLLVTGPVFASIKPYRSFPQAQPQWLPTWLLVLFVVGWLLTGAALRPGKSYSMGLLLGFLAYVIVGFAFAVTLSILFAENAFGVALFWPLLAAQMFGLFGMSWQ